MDNIDKKMLDDGMDVLDKKKLDDESELQIVTWISDMTDPGRQMYQLHMVSEGSTTQFPTDYENHTREKIEKLFAEINSVRDVSSIIGVKVHND